MKYDRYDVYGDDLTARLVGFAQEAIALLEPGERARRARDADSTGLLGLDARPERDAIVLTWRDGSELCRVPRHALLPPETSSELS